MHSYGLKHWFCLGWIQVIFKKFRSSKFSSVWHVLIFMSKKCTLANIHTLLNHVLYDVKLYWSYHLHPSLVWTLLMKVIRAFRPKIVAEIPRFFTNLNKTTFSYRNIATKKSIRPSHKSATIDSNELQNCSPWYLGQKSSY